MANELAISQYDSIIHIHYSHICILPLIQQHRASTNYLIVYGFLFSQLCFQEYLDKHPQWIIVCVQQHNDQTFFIEIQMKTLQKYQPTKMIDFISLLYKKYPVLNKLTEQESNKFQTEVISLLIDEDQNLQKQAYEDVIQKIGLGNFILQILSKTINRNKFKNQFQMNRNITQIADKLQKQKGQLDKRQKLLQRKEQKINKQDNQLVDKIRNFASKIEKDLITKLTQKQIQMKKNINNQLHKVKGKQKLLMEKIQEIKKSMKKLQEIDLKQKQLQQRVKQFDKRQKQWKTKQLDISNLNEKQEQVNTLKKQNELLKKQIKQMNIRLKNSDLAYRKTKGEISAKQNLCDQLYKQKEQLSHQIDKIKAEMHKRHTQRQNFKQRPKVKPPQLPSIQQAFDAMNISNIDQSECNQQKDNFFQDINQQNDKIKAENQRLLKIVSKLQNQKISKQSSTLMILNRKQNINFANIGENPEHKINEKMFNQQIGINLSFQSQEQSYTIISQLRSLKISQDQQKLKLIEQQKLTYWIQKCSRQMHYQKEVCLQLVNILVQLLEESKYYGQIIEYLSKQIIISFVQDVYLRYQTNDQISEGVTLILSRLQFADSKIKIKESFLKSIKIRLRINQTSPSMLNSNIKFIIEKCQI